jgi:hypothetical protein
MRSPFRPFSIAIACRSALFALAFWIPVESMATLVAMTSILLGVPVCILLYRGVRARHEAGPPNPIASAMLRVGRAATLVFGVAAILLGIVFKGQDVAFMRTYLGIGAV